VPNNKALIYNCLESIKQKLFPLIGKIEIIIGKYRNWALPIGENTRAADSNRKAEGSFV
jgi:hypothetical protein